MLSSTFGHLWHFAGDQIFPNGVQTKDPNQIGVIDDPHEGSRVCLFSLRLQKKIWRPTGEMMGHGSRVKQFGMTQMVTPWVKTNEPIPRGENVTRETYKICWDLKRRRKKTRRDKTYRNQIERLCGARMEATKPKDNRGEGVVPKQQKQFFVGL